MEIVVAWSAREVDDLSVNAPFCVGPIYPAKENMMVVGVCHDQAVCLKLDLLCAVIIRVLVAVWVDGEATSCNGGHVFRE